MPAAASETQVTSSLNTLLAKYDSALDLYDDLAKDISQMKKATQIVRQKTMKLLETKIRRKRALSIQGEALDVLLAAGVKAQQRRKAAGTRKSRRLSAAGSNHLKSPLKSPARRASILLDKPGPVDNLKVHFDLPGG
ncbi:hypothetical protein H0H92_006563 [Tricholoma furcatifolium]|nr:hypothetical protein H0H92_006563 [Tricholoma furcatifolium]